jgi:hypothetical protein
VLTKSAQGTKRPPPEKTKEMRQSQSEMAEGSDVGEHRANARNQDWTLEDE